MAISTFTEIIDAVLVHLERSDDVEITNLATTGLSLIESELFNDPNFWVKVTQVESNGVDDGNGKFSHTLPENWIRNVSVFDDQDIILDFSSPKLNLVNGEYIIVDDNIVTLSPTITIFYNARPERLSTQRQTSELVEKYPNILFYGTLRYVYQALGDPAWAEADRIAKIEIINVKSQNTQISSTAYIRSQYA